MLFEFEKGCLDAYRRCLQHITLLAFKRTPGVLLGIKFLNSMSWCIKIGGGDTGTDCIKTSIRHGCRNIINLELPLYSDSFGS
ncbi:hypothetical protein F0562_001643 [Nyssa sinensis]|uniref:Uncharacterized protein n=1 Tax=Nyssa sinensis TaxID=561372 RepID=A0A5J5C479_9ASTE|nr:hypothetical protein F0562_001643 [Nyssa sinensis]